MKPTNTHSLKWLKLTTALVLVALVTAILASGTTAVNAQATPPAAQPDAKAAITKAVRTMAETLLTETATTLNAKSADILAALAGGTTTLAAYVKTNSTDPNALSTIEAAALADLTTKINDAVTAGTLKQKAADRMLTALPTTLDKLANTPWPIQKGIITKLIDGRALKLLIDETATEAKIDEKTILADLRAGQTLAQIATANSADPTAIINAAVKTATNAINRVAKTGKISQDQADTVIGNLQEILTKDMNAVNPLNSPKSKRNAGTTPGSQSTPDATPDAASSL